MRPLLMTGLHAGLSVVVPAVVFATAAWELARMGREQPLDAALVGVFVACVALTYASVAADFASGRARPRRAPGVRVPRWMPRLVLGAAGATLALGLLSGVWPDSGWLVTLVYACFASVGAGTLAMARVVSRQLRAAQRDGGGRPVP